MGEKIIVYFFINYTREVNSILQSDEKALGDTLSMIGTRIQRHREQIGFTREKLAEESGLSVQSIVKVESGTRNFRILSLISISRALGLSTDYLLGLADYDDTLNIQLLLSVLDADGKAFIKDVIRLYIKSTQQ